jgi:hypothetical protein
MVSTGDVLKYVVLPVTLIGGVWLVLTQLLDWGNKALKAAAETLAYMWDDYNREMEEFLTDDNTIDTQEQAILDSKEELMRPLIEGMANAIPDPLEMEIVALSLVGAVVIAYGALTGKFNISGNLKKFIDSLKSHAGQRDPAWGAAMQAYSTPEEFAMIFRMATIMEIADMGNVSLASNLITTEQTRYFSNVIPQMQASYNLLAAQLPSLAGSQLALAQFQMTQYNLYIANATMLHPIFSFTPIIFPI